VSEENSQIFLRSARFRKGREQSWQKLDELVSKIEKKGLSSMTAKEAMELPTLYQAELSSLAVARFLILDRNLLEYLENLSLRAYLAVYGPRSSLWECLKAFFKTGLPSSVRALKYHVLITSVVFILAILVGFFAVHADNAAYNLFIPDNLIDGRNYQTTPSELEDYLHGSWEGIKEAVVFFANFLFRNNTLVALLCFSLGFIVGIPTIVLLIENGLIVGAMLALHYDKGLFVAFVGWLSIHGVTELMAIVLSGAAGLGIAEAIILPGKGSRLENLALSGKKAATVMIGVIIMLFLASILEGLFRQLIDSTFWRYLIAASTLVFWLWYYLKAGREAKNASPS
jgi:uncharacterized membrane protein SpoIIM required for sporulation